MSESIKIVELLENDVLKYAELFTSPFDPFYNEAWSATQIIDALNFPNTKLIGIMINREYVSFGLFRVILCECELLLLGVINNYRRMGIGKMLINEVASHAVDLGAKTMFVEVRQNNTATDFYSRLGMQTVGIRKNYYRDKNGKCYDAITMRADIGVDKEVSFI